MELVPLAAVRDLRTGDPLAPGSITAGNYADGPYFNFDILNNQIHVIGILKITGLNLNVVAKTTAYTAVETDDVITCGAGNESFTVDLPVPVAGKVFFIKNVGTGVITVDADTTGSTTIDGDTTQTVNQYECLQVIADASVYWAI